MLLVEMVRRLLLIAVLATLAAAVPASAQDDASDPLEVTLCPPFEACEEPVCTPLGPCPNPECPPLGLCEPACQVIETCEDGIADHLLLPSCELVYTDPSGTSNEPLVVDRDGCVRAIIRHVLGWPPTQAAFTIAPAGTVLRFL